MSSRTTMIGSEDGAVPPVRLPGVDTPGTSVLSVGVGDLELAAVLPVGDCGYHHASSATIRAKPPMIAAQAVQPGH